MATGTQSKSQHKCRKVTGISQVNTEQTWNCLTKYRCNRIMKWQTMNAETNTKTNAAPPRQPSKPKPLPNPTPWQKHERGLRGCCYRAVCIQKLKNNRKQRLTTQCETHTYAHRVKVESFPGITPPSHVYCCCFTNLDAVSTVPALDMCIFGSPSIMAHKHKPWRKRARVGSPHYGHGRSSDSWWWRTSRMYQLAWFCVKT